MNIGEMVVRYGPVVSGILSLIHIALSAVTIGWILAIKRDPMSALAWCLTVLLLPYIGPFLFYVFGYQHVYRPLKQKRQHMRAFRRHRIRQKSAGQASPKRLPVG